MPTSIQIEKEIKEHLDKLKNHPRETYNDVLARIINSISQQNREELSQQTIKNMEKSLADIKAGRVSSHKDVKQRLGLK
jgi:predicted transcriptional regulator